MDVLLEVKHLTKKFDGFTAVNNISFTVKKGEIVGFLGPNGAGKTTTIQMILGLIKPTRGRVKVATLSHFFAIEETLEKFYGQLSSGQATRVHLAKALLNDPELLFLDEPTASLDPLIADRTRKLLKRIQKERNLTILYTTHNMREVEELCDRAIFIHQGRIVTEGTPAKLIHRFGLADLNEVFMKIAFVFLADNRRADLGIPHALPRKHQRSRSKHCHTAVGSTGILELHPSIAAGSFDHVS